MSLMEFACFPHLDLRMLQMGFRDFPIILLSLYCCWVTSGVPWPKSKWDCIPCLESRNVPGRSNPFESSHTIPEMFWHFRLAPPEPHFLLNNLPNAKKRKTNKTNRKSIQHRPKISKFLYGCKINPDRTVWWMRHNTHTYWSVKWDGNEYISSLQMFKLLSLLFNIVYPSIKRTWAW